MTTITIRAGTVLRIGPNDFGAAPGWELSGPGWMITRATLPEEIPLPARLACRVLRHFGELTPQQRVVTDAAIAALCSP